MYGICINSKKYAYETVDNDGCSFEEAFLNTAIIAYEQDF